MIKQILLLFVSVLILSCGKSTEEYKKEMKTVVENDMLYLANAIAISSENVKVWNKAIKEGRNFSEELEKFGSNDEIVKLKVDMHNGREEMKKKMKSLKNPPSEMKENYELLMELYLKTDELTTLAMYPSGSYKSYSEKVEKLQSEIMVKLQELQLRF